MDFLKGYTLILGSKSPRRSHLLTEGGYSFEIRNQDADESFAEDVSPYQLPQMLALRKAEILFPSLKEKELLITADSIVLVEGKILNKPENYEEAISMLKALSGNKHTVITGVALTTTEKQNIFAVQSHIHFDDINEAEMDYYISNYQPFDKAGGYGIQDWIGINKIAAIEGSYTNVMGLPMRELYLQIQDFIDS